MRNERYEVAPDVHLILLNFYIFTVVIFEGQYSPLYYKKEG